MNKGKLIVLSAPSGAGKTSICKQLLKRNSDWKFSISATTRSLREGEKDGIDYIKMSNEKFEHCVRFGDFLEWEFVHGNKYGTPIGPLEDALDHGNVMLLDIDVKGGMTIMEEFPEESLGIFIEPPGDNHAEKLEVLEDRLSSRSNDASKLIKTRLKRFALELEYKEKFNYHFVNDNLNKTMIEIEKVIKENIQ